MCSRALKEEETINVTENNVALMLNQSSLYGAQSPGSLRSCFSWVVELCSWQRLAEVRNGFTDIHPCDPSRRAVCYAREVGKKNP